MIYFKAIAIRMGYKLGPGSNLLNEARLMVQLGILRMPLITPKTCASIADANIEEGIIDTLLLFCFSPEVGFHSSRG